MKQKFFILNQITILFAYIFTLMSCGGNDDTNEGANNPPVPENNYEYDIVARMQTE